MVVELYGIRLQGVFNQEISVCGSADSNAFLSINALSQNQQ